MRILLINGNREQLPYPVMPIGLCMVASALAAAGHQVAVEDLCFARDPEASVREAILHKRPQLIGIGLRNLDNCDPYAPKPYLPDAAALVADCRQLCDAPIMIGGAGVGIMPAPVLRRTAADFAVVGDGERPAVALAAVLEAGEAPDGIPGVHVRRGDEVTSTPVQRVEDLDELEPPRIYEWIDIRPYLRTQCVYPVQTKRGCALACNYCSYRRIEGPVHRCRDPEAIVDEIEQIHRRAGVDEFEFVDSTFNVPAEHAIAICRALKRRALPVRFNGNGFNPLDAPALLLREMKRAGFDWIVCTADSASDPVLERMRKGFTVAQLVEVARRAQRVRLPMIWIFLVGGPGETRQTVRETLDFIHTRLGPRDVAYITGGVRVLPGTPMERIALDEGLIPDRDSLIEPVFYNSPEVDPEWLREELRRFARKEPRLVTPDMSLSSLAPLGLKLMSMAGLRGPFWQLTPLVNRMMPLISPMDRLVDGVTRRLTGGR